MTIWLSFQYDFWHFEEVFIVLKVVMRLSVQSSMAHWSGKETLKFFERWKDKTQVTTILYIICNNTFLGWNWNIIKIEALALSTTIFQTYSLALDGADLSINEISCSWLFFSFILLSMSFLNITLNHTTTLLFKALFHYSI